MRGAQRVRRSFGDVLQRLMLTDPETVKALEHLARKADARVMRRLAQADRRLHQRKKAS
jgi:hypothetical protein